MTLELLLAGATVTTCHRFTRDLEHYVAVLLRNTLEAAERTRSA